MMRLSFKIWFKMVGQTYFFHRELAVNIGTRRNRILGRERRREGQKKREVCGEGENNNN